MSVRRRSENAMLSTVSTLRRLLRNALLVTKRVRVMEWILQILTATLSVSDRINDGEQPSQPSRQLLQKLIVSRQRRRCRFCRELQSALPAGSSLDATAYAARGLRCKTKTLQLTCA